MYEDGVNFYMFVTGFVKLAVGIVFFVGLAYLLDIERVWVKKEQKIQAFESAMLDKTAEKHKIDLNKELAKLSAYNSKTFREIVKEQVLEEVKKKQ